MVDDPELRSAVSTELERGEKLLWVGRPSPLRVVIQNHEALAVGVIVLVTLVSIALLFPNAHIFSFNLIGLGFTFGWLLLFFALLSLTYFARPIYDYFMARRTLYALTDRRAIILQATLRGRITRSYRRFDPIKRRNLLNGKGDLIFGSQIYTVRGRVSMRKIGFFGIDHAREVEQLMQKTFSQQPANHDD